ncbi:MAG: 4-alpha-glucanotransferase [Lachnospiraceae bacterium]|nr:4-alpha-glucanotransferase [Lachnospiraceae bacterium]MBQ2319761.1 4-alpha-glucanotransferase [Lachnospiraceae bacterium]
MRASGILMPVTSLPSKYGIGCFSKSAYDFVDFLEEAGQTYWQILPLGMTSYGDSPYQSFSTYAGNPYMIDLCKLIEEGLLTEEECDAKDFGDNDRYIDYSKIYNSRYDILRLAFERSNIESDKEFKRFEKKNAFWLEDFALFMAIKKKYDDVSWIEWPQELQDRQKKAIDKCKEELSEDIMFHKYLQFVFEKQWRELKKYANDKNIQIIGDIPIYVALDSSDVWSDKGLFQFDKDGQPKAVAGCPPDAFSETGQLWGNPLYDWDYNKKTGYEWWIKRIERCVELYDVIRIDHFRAFDQYYSIPYGDPTAEFGEWKDGPGMDLFKSIEKKLGKLHVIAEDLGFLTDTVKKLVEDSGFPGMKVIEFAFDSREDSDYLPHTYDKNCVVYTGTHDNETVRGWYENMNKDDKAKSIEYMNNKSTPLSEIHWDFIRLAMLSVADTCIIPIQDYLGLGNEARINTPSTIGNNWHWRMLEDEINDELVEKIKKLTIISSRLQKES